MNSAEHGVCLSIITTGLVRIAEKSRGGFKTKREATEWERHFRMKEAVELDMTFEDFVKVYTRDMKSKLKRNTWLTKEHILRTKLLPYFKDKKMRDIRPTDIIQ